jgi:ligand-binding sensor domain-containing protein
MRADHTKVSSLKTLPYAASAEGALIRRSDGCGRCTTNRARVGNHHFVTNEPLSQIGRRVKLIVYSQSGRLVVGTGHKIADTRGTLNRERRNRAMQVTDYERFRWLPDARAVEDTIPARFRRLGRERLKTAALVATVSSVSDT